MFKISRYRQELFLKKLSTFNVFVLTVLHILVPVLVVLGCNIVVHWQMSIGRLDDITVSYYSKVIFLAILLCVVVLGTLDVLFIVNPIMSLENVVDEYGRLVKIDEIDIYEKYFTNSSLEKMFFDMVYEQKRLIEKQYTAELLRKETELLALQSQINPHFLYNTLDSIRGLALLNGVDAIADMTEALSKLFRGMIAKNGKMITLEEEFENTRNYMIIQQFRFNNKIKYTHDIEPSVMRCYLVPNMIIQPLVENAIMHGIEKKLTGGEIKIKAYCTRKRLVIDIQDNGVGIEKKKLEELNRKLKESAERSSRYEKQSKHSGVHTGIALTNINQRLKIQFGQEYGLSIMSTKNVYTNVQLVFPLIEAPFGEGE